MLSVIESVNAAVNNFIWGVPAMICIIGVGLYLSIRTNFLQIRKFPYAIKVTIGRMLRKREASDGSLTPFQAVCTALAATVGTGNIAGVAGAIAIGGPGAVFWMWCSALLGMCTKFAEVTLAVHFRERSETGEWVGGPMYYIKNGLGKRWQFLAFLYSLFGVLTVFGTGNATQVNTIVAAVDTALLEYGVVGSSFLSTLNLIVGIIVAMLVAMVLLGGIKRIGSVSERLVPFMALFYIILAIGVVIINWKNVPGVFGSIVSGAFNPASVTGGAVGSGLHSVDFDVNDEELAYIVTAKIFALTAYRLLKGGAVAAKKLVDDYKPIFTKQEYIDFMEEIGGSATGKSLPVSNFVGYQVSGFPHFRNYPNGQGFLVTHLGFYFWKYYNRHVDNMALRSSTVDYLLFGIEEVMLNYAEAKFELGEFSQSVADATINKLRVRAVIPAMNVSEIDASFDLNRDQSVDPVLWEIRRERRIELMGDGFRFRDLKRWKKGEYVNKQPLGAWVKSSDYGSKLNILGGADEGYSILFAKPSGWMEKYYLEPIPTQEIALNPKLKQNPGWETAE